MLKNINYKKNKEMTIMEFYKLALRIEPCMIFVFF